MKRKCRACGKSLPLNYFFCNTRCAEAYQERHIPLETLDRIAALKEDECPDMMVLPECRKCEHACKTIARIGIEKGSYKLTCKKYGKEFNDEVHST